MEYISFEHNNIAAELVKQAYDTPPLAFVLNFRNTYDLVRIQNIIAERLIYCGA